MAGLAVPLSAPPPGVAIAPSRGFAAFDDRVLAAQPGLVVARAPESAHESLLTHAGRRLRTSGFDPIVVTGAPVVRELALQLGVRMHADVRVTAEAIVQAATTKRSVLLVTLPDPATWDGAVLAEVVKDDAMLVVGIAAEPHTPWTDETSDTFDLGSNVRGADRLRWLGAIAEEAQQELRSDALEELEAWWRGARGSVAPLLSAEGRDLLAALGLVGRSVPATRASAHVVAELTATGAVRVRDGRIVASEVLVEGPAEPQSAPSTSVQRALAIELLEPERGAPFDPWDAIRQAELLVDGEPTRADIERADALARRAFEAAVDPRGGGARAHRCWPTATPRRSCSAVARASSPATSSPRGSRSSASRRARRRPSSARA